MTQAKSNRTGTMLPSLFTDFFGSDRLFDNQWLERQFGQSLPPVNIRENNEEFNIEFAVPGFKKQDFKIDVEGSLLTINAEKSQESVEEKGHFTRKEFSFNSFSRSFTLPQNVNADKIDAKYHEGILKLHIPKKEVANSPGRKEIQIA